MNWTNKYENYNQNQILIIIYNFIRFVHRENQSEKKVWLKCCVCVNKIRQINNFFFFSVSFFVVDSLFTEHWHTALMMSVVEHHFQECGNEWKVTWNNWISMHKKHFFSFLFEQGEKYRFSIELKMLSYRAQCSHKVFTLLFLSFYSHSKFLSRSFSFQIVIWKKAFAPQRQRHTHHTHTQLVNWKNNTKYYRTYRWKQWQRQLNAEKKKNSCTHERRRQKSRSSEHKLEKKTLKIR